MLKRRRRCILHVGLLVAALAVAACGGSSQPNTGASGASGVSGPTGPHGASQRQPTDLPPLAVPPRQRVNEPRSRAMSKLPNSVSYWSRDRGLIGTGSMFKRQTGGGIYLTTDGGATFHRVLRTAWGVGWIDTAGTEDAWAVLQSASRGEPQALIHTSDGGQTWHRLKGKPPWAPSFATAKTGLAIATPRGKGSYEAGGSLPSAHVVKTRDGGRSWSGVKSPCPTAGGGYRDGATVTMVSPTLAWAVCAEVIGAGSEENALLRSDDGGRSWVKVVPQCASAGCLAGYAYSLSFDPEGSGLFVSDSGDPVFISADGQVRSTQIAGKHAIGTIAAQQITSADAVALTSGFGRNQLVASHDGDYTWEEVHAWPWSQGSGCC